MAEPGLETNDSAEDVGAVATAEEAPANGVHAAGSIGADAEEPSHDDLLGEFARAMHQAATSQYERMNLEVDRRRAEQVERITLRAGTEVENLKAGSESDIGAIDAWSRNETEKIKLERLRRIDARREQLASQLERQDTIRERELAAIQVAIEAHRSEIDLFFGRMQREADPATIAMVASTIPPFPQLADVAEAARRSAAAEYSNDEIAITTAPTPVVTSATPAVAAATDMNVAVADATPTDAADAESETATPPETSDSEATPVTADLEANAPEAVTESRLMAVMDPGAARAEDGAPARPWEAPYAVSVTAGSDTPEAAEDAGQDVPSRVGSTLLRTVRAIRPMSDRHENKPDGDDAPH